MPCTTASMDGEIFGSFGLSTKELYTIINCPSCVIIGVGVCIPPPGTELNIETSYFMSSINAHQIFGDSDLWFLNGSHFGRQS